MKFLIRSILIVLALYGLIFALGNVALMKYGVPMWGAVLFSVLFVGFQYVISPWVIQWVLTIGWGEGAAILPEANRQFVEKLCAERGLKVPKIGIIYSGTPNAFSFGRLRSDARVVVTQGLLDMLTVEESNAVLAHEIGHIEHYDFAVMTVASVAPLLLYQIYIWTRGVKQARLIAYGAYLSYCVSQFVVLLINRQREYYADHYAADVTHQPDALSSALVKIAYGMVTMEGKYQQALHGENKDAREYWADEQRMQGALGVMGISNLHSAGAVALSGADPAAAAAVMQWDLTNPWARVYEMNSTHPLTALRVQALNDYAAAHHEPSSYALPSDTRTRWSDFPMQFVLWAAPMAAMFVLFTVIGFPGVLRDIGVIEPPMLRPALLVFIGVTWILRVMYRYHGKFEDATVTTLLRDLEVSEMHPRAVRLRGKILGRGVPGAFWSPDLVLQDSTGIIFLLYRQSIPFARWLFAISKAENYFGQDVVVEGWLRRRMAPYVEMSTLRMADERDGKTMRSYSRWVQCALSAIAIGIGLVWLSAFF